MLEYILQRCDMSGYGIYVWPCYALFLLTLSWQIFKALRRDLLVHSKLKQELWSRVEIDKQA